MCNKSADVRGFRDISIVGSIGGAPAPQMKTTGWTGGNSCTVSGSGPSLNAPGVGSAFAKFVYGMTTAFQERSAPNSGR